MLIELLQSIEKAPKHSKKVFIFSAGLGGIVAVALLSVIANMVAALAGAAPPVDPMLAGAFISGIAGLAGVAVNQQQKTDSAVRVAMIEAAGKQPDSGNAHPPVDVEI